jgi:hypothetical protein
VIVAAGQVRVRHGASEVAVHRLVEGRRQRVIDKAHLAGVAGTDGRPVHAASALPDDPEPPPLPALLRPLADYEALAGGAF